MRTAIAGLMALALGVSPASAQETRIGEEGFASPPAQIGDLAWLVGQWSGVGIAGAPAMESWLPPAGGTMVGSFVQESADLDGRRSIRFTEHMYIHEHEGSLVLSLKHFNADLTGWEEKDAMVRFRLLVLEPCAAYFHALTLRCADPEHPGEGLVAAVRMRSDSHEPRELVFRFEPLQRQGDAGGEKSCDRAVTSGELTGCLAQKRDRATDRHRIYRAAAIARHRENSAAIEAIAATEKAHRAYAKAECGGAGALWQGGSIRPAMVLACQTALIDQRTRTIWQNWLAGMDGMDGADPGLPEPQPTL